MIIQLHYFSSMRFMIRTALLRNIINKYNIEFTKKLNFSKNEITNCAVNNTAGVMFMHIRISDVSK
jgi:hypothetical protein